MKSLGLQVGSLVDLNIHEIMDNIAGQDAGYNHVNLDDCYAERNRSPDGFIVPGQRAGPTSLPVFH